MDQNISRLLVTLLCGQWLTGCIVLEPYKQAFEAMTKQDASPATPPLPTGGVETSDAVAPAVARVPTTELRATLARCLEAHRPEHISQAGLAHEFLGTSCSREARQLSRDCFVRKSRCGAQTSCSDASTEFQCEGEAETVANSVEGGWLRASLERSRAEYDSLPKVVAVKAKMAGTVVPGALVCPDLPTTELMWDWFNQSYIDRAQAAAAGGDAALLYGSPTRDPPLQRYGCVLVAPGSVMQLERGHQVPVVTVTLPNEHSVRGVTFPSMIDASAVSKGFLLTRP